MALSLTPNFSWVCRGRGGQGTVSAVSFSHPVVLLCACSGRSKPLKRLDERRRDRAPNGSWVLMRAWPAVGGRHGEVRRADMQPLSGLRVIHRRFPSVGPPPLCPRRSNAGLKDVILSGLRRRGAATRLGRGPIQPRWLNQEFDATALGRFVEGFVSGWLGSFRRAASSSLVSLEF